MEQSMPDVRTCFEQCIPDEKTCMEQCIPEIRTYMEQCITDVRTCMKCNELQTHGNKSTSIAYIRLQFPPYSFSAKSWECNHSLR